jgi:hypothetical protein
MGQQGVRQVGAGVDEMLAVIEDQENFSISEVCNKRIFDRLTRATATPQRSRDRIGHQVVLLGGWSSRRV